MKNVRFWLCVLACVLSAAAGGVLTHLPPRDPLLDRCGHLPHLHLPDAPPAAGELAGDLPELRDPPALPLVPPGGGAGLIPALGRLMAPPARNLHERAQDATLCLVAGSSHFSGVAVRTPDGAVWVWTVAHGARHARRIDHEIVAGLPPKPAAPAAPAAEEEEEEPPAEPSPVWRTRVSYAPILAVQMVCADGCLVAQRGWEAVVVRIDETEDLALLRLSEPHAPVLGTLRWHRGTPRLGDPVVVAGAPGGRSLAGSVVGGRISFVGRPYSIGGRMATSVCDQTDAPTLPGFSGGPICAADGSVLGLVHGGPGESCTVFAAARRVRAWAEARGVLFAFDGTRPPAAAVWQADGVESLPPESLKPPAAKGEEEQPPAKP